MTPLTSLELKYDQVKVPILVGPGALGAAAPELETWWRERILFLLTSERILYLLAEQIRDLAQAAAAVIPLVVPDGEAAKTVPVCHQVWEDMLRRGGKRDSRLLALGGGTIGDLGGFVAGSFLRGIEFVQLPTTLLAQVDASVGGKTGVDLEGGKNSVGLFYHPQRVVADTRFLESLPRAEVRCGLMEVVKMATLLDPPLLDDIEKNIPALLDGDLEVLSPVIARAVAAKVKVVTEDPKEKGPRRLLNYGHTFAHALEAVERYEGLRHGDGVGYGMLFALRLASRRGLDPALGRRLVELIRGFELPPLPATSPEALWQAMTRDKKATEKGLVWVLPRHLGEGRMTADVSREEVLQELETFLASPYD